VLAKLLAPMRSQFGTHRIVAIPTLANNSPLLLVVDTGLSRLTVIAGGYLDDVDTVWVHYLAEALRINCKGAWKTRKVDYAKSHVAGEAKMLLLLNMYLVASHHGLPGPGSTYNLFKIMPAFKCLVFHQLLEWADIWPD
jgi:hypothetical protein